MLETWIAVKGYEGLYEVSDLGNVRSCDKIVPFKNSFTRKKGRLISRRKLGDYLISVLCKNGKKKTHLVHRLVAEAFKSNPQNKGKVNHLDCDPLNNRAVNLEWCSQKENIDYAVSLKRHCHGETHGCHKLTEDEVREIKRSKMGCYKLAKLYPVSITNIKRIRAGKIWKHVA